MNAARTLYLDIETSPMIAYAWRTFKENISAEQIIEPSRVLCMAWAWDDKPVKFLSEWQIGREEFIAQLWALLDKADLVVHYNGTSFDVPHLNREFVEIGLSPPSPYAQVDLYKTVRRTFKFQKNSLAWVSKRLLEDEEKGSTTFSLWRRVLDNQPAARREMKTYNMQDVLVTRDVYKKIQAWVPSHPNVGLYVESEVPVCLSCGGESLRRRGFAYTGSGRFQRFTCLDCGRWMRSAKREGTTSMREARL
jgi:DNA polymerase elongation subunit (family B)